MFLCQMSGIPGTGKSMLARYICNTTRSVLLDLDVIKSSVLASFKQDIDFSFAGKVAYETIFSLAESNLAVGNSVVIDSPCAYEAIIENGTALTNTYKVPYKFIECYLEDLSELNRRRTMREILPSQQYNTPIDEITFQDSIKALKRPLDHAYLLVDTSREIDKYIEKIMDYLNEI